MIKFKKDLLFISILTGLVVVFALVINVYKAKLKVQNANYSPGKLIRPIRSKINKPFWQFLKNQTQPININLIYNAEIQPKNPDKKIFNQTQASESGKPAEPVGSPSGQINSVAPSQNKT